MNQEMKRKKKASTPERETADSPTVLPQQTFVLLRVGPGPPRHMAVSGRLPARPPGCKRGCRRNLGCCLPHSCFGEISQSWVIQVQPHCSRSGSKTDLGRRTGVSHWVDCRVGCALWVFLEGVYVLRKGGREATEKGCAICLYHQPPPPSAGPSCCSAGRASGTAGPGSWAGPWGRVGSHRLRAPHWHPGNACLQAQG